MAADATELASARRACQGTAVVYHCAATPYATWPQTLPRSWTGSSLERPLPAPGSSLATTVLLRAGLRTAHRGPSSRATGPNGRVRAQLAEALLAAHERGTVRATIGRASDFFGPHVRVSAMGDRVFPAALAGRPAQVLPTRTCRTPTRSSTTSPRRWWSWRA